jgi:hypothetical protein
MKYFSSPIKMGEGRVRGPDFAKWENELSGVF